MKKVLKVVLIILGIIILAGIYFYFFHVFKTLRVCVKSESSDLMIDCSSNQDCLDFVKGKSETYTDDDLEKLPDFIKDKIKDNENAADALKEIFEQIDSAPDFFSETINEIIEEALYCDLTCRYKEFYGSEPLGEGDVDECASGEKEFVIKIRGKEGLKLWGWMKEGGVGLAVFDF